MNRRSRTDAEKFARRPVRRGARGSGFVRTHMKWRLGIAALAFVFGAFSVSSSFAQFIARNDARTAHIFAPGDGLILARYASDLLVRFGETEPGSQASMVARQALVANPTAVDALSVLALQAELRGETDEANRIFALSSQLSRRELQPRLWAIEKAVMRGDVSGALRHYDIALRTSGDAQQMLFPTLTAALDEPRLREEVLAILRTSPAWKEAFAKYAVASGIEPAGVVALIRADPANTLGISDPQRALLVNQLMWNGDPDASWAFFRSLRPEADLRQLRNQQFDPTLGSNAIYDWQVADTASLSAALLGQEEDTYLEFSLAQGNGGPIVRQTQMLPPGTYRLAGTSEFIDQAAASQPYWLLSCQDGRELGRVPVSNSQVNAGHFSGTIEVTGICQVQVLTLVARGSDRREGLLGRIRTVGLTPID